MRYAFSKLREWFDYAYAGAWRFHEINYPRIEFYRNPMFSQRFVRFISIVFAPRR